MTEEFVWRIWDHKYEYWHAGNRGSYYPTSKGAEQAKAYSEKWAVTQGGEVYLEIVKFRLVREDD